MIEKSTYKAVPLMIGCSGKYPEIEELFKYFDIVIERTLQTQSDVTLEERSELLSLSTEEQWIKYMDKTARKWFQNSGTWWTQEREDYYVSQRIKYLRPTDLIQSCVITIDNLYDSICDDCADVVAMLSGIIGLEEEIIESVSDEIYYFKDNVGLFLASYLFKRKIAFKSFWCAVSMGDNYMKHGTMNHEMLYEDIENHHERYPDCPHPKADEYSCDDHVGFPLSPQIWMTPDAMEYYMNDHTGGYNSPYCIYDYEEYLEAMSIDERPPLAESFVSAVNRELFSLANDEDSCRFLIHRLLDLVGGEQS